MDSESATSHPLDIFFHIPDNALLFEDELNKSVEEERKTTRSSPIQISPMPKTTWKDHNTYH